MRERDPRMFKNLRKVFGGDPIGRELERCADRIEAITAVRTPEPIAVYRS